ncbi:ADP-ribosylation factor-like protein 6-interacting protein 6 [Cyclopterus lumpus]|uniref:ADP-ribosylation factor-like protein 6-interacting protein 6 n=1 Tax=Cyclopterus lumpus TaxID=8103 RepID=A0A8C2XAT3_CYCLU|nr:ADP-ribosylation factor-like protein 6-interacting protein 6 [Cyclopterus lumpus]XP_034405333.1 ADP-ribosylation factor-like protein 6-interacting protein 6 [Cyclopterus lumpus]XP_034405343.1 ADP-ribosylation factor-like protein 6-interacting protein 6 [Cyclopterus lumpus]XP_034405352.1 ADP-ribosylation factor-like protein 6-interacting protein 6 [Cyclopterus lumpus]
MRNRTRATDRNLLIQDPSCETRTMSRPGLPPCTKPWSALSVVCSAGVVAAGGGVCALIYPILKELRAERVSRPDWTEERVLGLWSILVLSVFVGCVCCFFSWTLTELDSYRPAVVSGSPRTHLREVSDPGCHMGCGVAVLNGIMAMLTVIWSLI